MNRNEKRRIISLALIFVLTIVMFSGCGFVQVNPEKDRARW